MLQFLKRWGVYIAVTLLLLGSGGAAGFSGMAAMLAWSVYPLLRAASQAPHIAVLAMLAHSLIGGGVIFALRPMLWPTAWREAESALPLSRACLRRSDAQVVLLALLPVAAVYAGGMATWLASGAAWVAPVRTMGLYMVLASLVGSVAWGMLVLQLWRRPVRWSSPVAVISIKSPDFVATNAYKKSATGHFYLISLILLPLWRGPARRVGTVFLAGMGAGMACCAALLRWPDALGWSLAVYALLSLALTTRLCKLINTDLAPLHDACAPLPIAPADLLRTRQALALMPQICALLMVGVTGLALRHTLHLAPLLGFVLTSSAFHAVLVLKCLARRSGQPQDEAAWWLVALVIVVAFASEVGL
jgi:hypothetical protein